MSCTACFFGRCQVYGCDNKATHTVSFQLNGKKAEKAACSTEHGHKLGEGKTHIITPCELLTNH